MTGVLGSRTLHTGGMVVVVVVVVAVVVGGDWQMNPEEFPQGPGEKQESPRLGQSRAHVVTTPDHSSIKA